MHSGERVCERRGEREADRSRWAGQSCSRSGSPSLPEPLSPSWSRGKDPLSGGLLLYFWASRTPPPPSPIAELTRRQVGSLEKIASLSLPFSLKVNLLNYYCSNGSPARNSRTRQSMRHHVETGPVNGPRGVRYPASWRLFESRTSEWVGPILKAGKRAEGRRCPYVGDCQYGRRRARCEVELSAA